MTALIVNWKTSAADGREHAVPDSALAPNPTALCGHRVVERRCSMLTPAGGRCERCDTLRRAPHPARPALAAAAVALLRRMGALR